MEIPFTYEAVEETKKDYLKRYPNLKFYTTKPPKDGLGFWLLMFCFKEDKMNRKIVLGRYLHFIGTALCNRDSDSKNLVCG